MQSNTTEQGTKKRIRKSVALTREEKVALNKALKTFPTQQDAVDVFGIERGPLYRIAQIGSGKETSIIQIRTVLSTFPLTAA